MAEFKICIFCIILLQERKEQEFETVNVSVGVWKGFGRHIGTEEEKNKGEGKLKVSDEESLTFLNATSCDHPRSTMADRKTGRGREVRGRGETR